MKKFVSLFLALTLAISLCVMPASAAYTKASRVNIHASSTKIRVGRTLQLEERVYPRDLDYSEVEWSTDDYSVIELDEYGEVTGLMPGEATVRCRIFGYPDDGSSPNKMVRLGSQDITITVVKNLYSDSSSSKSSSSSSSTSSKSSSSTVSGSKISTSDVNAAVKKAVVRGKTKSTTFKDVGSISASALQAAAVTMKNGGGTVLLNFDTTTNGKSVEGRLTINPAAAAKVKGDTKLGVYTNDGAVSKTRTKFEKYFKNDVVIIKAAHSGSYGMDVTYAVKIGKSLSTKDLRIYTYDPDTNKYSEISGSNIWIDSNKYVHFTTSLGDYLVVSAGKLAKK